MKRKILLIVFAIFTFTYGFSQNPLWTKVSEGRIDSKEKVERTSIPSKYQLFHLDFEALKQQLQSAPSRNSGNISNVILAFPDAEGRLKNYRVYESSVMEAGLAIKHPEIQSYIGQGLDDSTAKIHFTTTIFGLHTMTLSGNGTFYIDPYTKDLQNYIVYDKTSLTSTRNFECLVQDDLQTATTMGIPQTTFANDGIFRTYRLAMACTTEYAAYHINAAGLNSATLAVKKDAVLAAMNVTVTRVNSVYENDMSLRMVLVNNNMDIIYVTSDSFTNDDAEELIDESQSVITSIIGSANFDIGHTVSTGGGGLAASPSVCTSFKASGITGSFAPVGDPFNIDYVAHEMGHQFGADHTFNGTGGSCTGNRSAQRAVEPGSGSTIMGYAGICTNNVQPNSDAYFHAVSLAQMFNHITSVNGNCVTGIANGNTPPSVAVLTNYTIPKGTPFVLKGTASDADGDMLTYCWEQTNPGANTSNPSATSTASNPNFRSFSPTTSPNRYFPSLTNILNNNLASTWEVIPQVARTMNFALTVRDNNTPNGGQTNRQNMTVTFDGTAGPFKVTSQNTDGLSWNQGETRSITWDVAGTTASPVNTATVNIRLSTDGGLTYPILLASNTPNDGSENIVVPNIAAPFCRIMVEAVNNIYFAVNPNTFAIGYTVTTENATYTNGTDVAIPDGNGFYTTSQIYVPSTNVVSKVTATVAITHSYIGDLYLTLTSPQGTSTTLWQESCGTNNNMSITFSDAGSGVVCASPTTGTFAPVGSLSSFINEIPQGNWTLALADAYAGDAGTLTSWSLDITTFVTTLKNENFGLKDFKLYPNPNTGNFNVEFNSETSNDINVTIYDISGRQIFNKAYPNTGSFLQNLQLNNVQSGVYLVNINDGDKKEIRKIIID